MKGNVIILILIIVFIIPAFAEEGNYNNGNGTIIEQKIENNKQITIRKYENRLELYSINSDGGGYRVNGEDILIIFDEPKKNANVIFIIPTFPVITWINTILLRYEKSLNNDKDNSWLYVKTDDGKIGWLYLGISYDPYEGGRWSILEEIMVQNKKWTIRNLNGYLSIWETIIVRDKPGIIGTSILFKIQNEKNCQLGVSILAITEEEDIIDGETDYWVKIKDKQNRIGWIFGGYASVERGGPKYYTPDASISFEYAFP